MQAVILTGSAGAAVHNGPRIPRMGKYLRYRPADVESWVDGPGTEAA